MEIKLLSFNIHKGVGWKTRKSTIHQIHNEIIELQPDLVLLQEVLKSQFQTLSSTIWPHCHYGTNVALKKDHLGNAILSKYPITLVDNLDLSMHRFEHRGLLHGMMQIPGQQDSVHLLCVHLGLFPSDRRKQIDKIIEYVSMNIPDHLPIILGGDFNDWNSYATKPLKAELGLSEAFLLMHRTCARTYPSWSPVFKLDRVYFRGFEPVRAQRLLNESWKNLSDHIGIEVALECHNGK